MKLRLSCTLLFLSASLLSAAEFRTGAAARAVIGQSSFSSREPGIVAHALSVSKGVLYVADDSNQVLAFDTAHLVGSRAGACGVCVTTPVSVTDQGVIPGVASSVAYGPTVVVADASSHRVMIWRSFAVKPDVVLGSMVVDPVSVAFDGQRLFVGDAALHRVLVWKSLPATDDQPADAVLGQMDAADGTGADTIQTPAALASDGSNLYVADAAARRVLVYSPGDTPLSGKQILNAASLTPGPVAPGSLLSIEYPVSGGGDSLHVLLDGLEMPLLEVTGDVIQTQVPYSVTPSAASLVVRAEHGDGSASFSDAVGVSLVAASPGVYAFGGKEPRSGLLLHAGEPVTAENPAKPGEVLTVWATGLGAVNGPAGNKAVEVITPVNVLINGEPAAVLSATLPEAAVGVYEVHVQVPPSITPGRPATLLLSQNDIKSNAVIFPVAPEN
jgi:uncharacterized protein (TIGR03437 family)